MSSLEDGRRTTQWTAPEVQYDISSFGDLVFTLDAQ